MTNFFSLLALLRGRRPAARGLASRAGRAFALLLLLTLLPGLAQAQDPVIAGFSPPSGPAGTPVTVTGTNLNAVRGVRFGGSSELVPLTEQSTNSLTVLVPGAWSGHLPQHLAPDEFHELLELPRQIIGVGVATLGVELRELGDGLHGGFHDKRGWVHREAV